MNLQLKPETIQVMEAFRLPRYSDIPNVGLYLNQVAKYINETTAPLGDVSITESMISNYVKKRLVARPVKKQYDKEQIAHLIFITLAKSVLSMEDIQLLFHLKETTYSSETAYDYFCGEFENALRYVFGVQSHMEEIGQDSNDIKALLRSVIITLTRKLHLNQCFLLLKEPK